MSKEPRREFFGAAVGRTHLGRGLLVKYVSILVLYWIEDGKREKYFYALSGVVAVVAGFEEIERCGGVIYLA